MFMRSLLKAVFEIILTPRILG
uniref:Uncharacterized protein n=1 Tax=Lepeophtheirus salmonis TaxID=72036 RepID=A0A0K2UFL8_LEPSM